jgi:hypothetical protein
MGSKSFNRLAVPLTALALALAPAAASAVSVNYSMNGATGTYAPPVVHKNYSLNGATGDYMPAINIPKVTTPVAPASGGRSFAWGDAAIGASSALLIVLLGGLTVLRVRHRRIAAPTPARPSAA